MITLAIHTANQWPDSVCHISLAKVKDDTIIDTLDTYIHATEFDPFFTSLHGITAQDVQHAPTFAKFAPILTQWLTNEDVVAFYAPYEAQVLHDVYEAHDLLAPTCQMYSVQPIAKTTYPSVTPTLPQFALHITKQLAPTESEMLAHILCETKWQLSDFVEQTPNVAHTITSLIGETVVFTGGLAGMTRSTAARLIRQQGAMFSNTITKHTTVLVVSETSMSRYEQTGHESTKLRRAKQLQAQGQNIRIMSEAEFKQLL